MRGSLHVASACVRPRLLSTVHNQQISRGHSEECPANKEYLFKSNVGSRCNIKTSLEGSSSTLLRGYVEEHSGWETSSSPHLSDRRRGQWAHTSPPIRFGVYLDWSQSYNTECAIHCMYMLYIPASALTIFLNWPYMRCPNGGPGVYRRGEKRSGQKNSRWRRA